MKELKESYLRGFITFMLPLDLKLDGFHIFSYIQKGSISQNIDLTELVRTKE